MCPHGPSTGRRQLFSMTPKHWAIRDASVAVVSDVDIILGDDKEFLKSCTNRLKHSQQSVESRNEINGLSRTDR